MIKKLKIDGNQNKESLALKSTQGTGGLSIVINICTLHNFFLLDFWCFNATFSNISAISWRPNLVVEEAGVPRENHQPFIINVPLNEKKAQLCIFIYMFLPSGRRFSQFFLLHLQFCHPFRFMI
jgi:hypothetical protein